jgi:ADP-ribosylglycohydrolase
MIGSIAGDIIGSVFEFHPYKRTDFDLFGPASRFTDDTVLTVALADAILHGLDYADALKTYWKAYPHRGYGNRFRGWARGSLSGPYMSCGNGSAMRTAPVGWAYGTLEETLGRAEKYSAVTHNHPEGIKGAQAVAAAIYLARTGAGKNEIRDYVSHSFGYDLSRSCNQIRPGYRFDETCQATVPEAVTAFLESTDYESAVRLAVSLGGDADTLGCITGGMAEAFYGGVPKGILEEVRARLDGPLLRTTQLFMETYSVPGL